MADFNRERLVKILGMTGSEHDGEALAALRKAQQIMAEGKVTWAELLSPPAAQSRWTPPRQDHWQEQERQRREQEWREFEEQAARKEKARARHEKLRAACAVILAKYRWLLTDWEVGFLEDWASKPEGARMSEKQQAIFERVLARYNAKRKAAA